MRKSFAVFFALVCMLNIFACGSTPEISTVYNLPTPVAQPSYPSVFGGAVQGQGHSLVFNTPISDTLLAGSIAGLATNCTGANAEFNRPFAITTDGINLYVADFWNNSIRQISLAAPWNVTTIAGNLAGISGSSDSTAGVGTSASFFHPNGITTDGHNNLFVTDSGNFTIRMISLISPYNVTTVAGSAGSAGTTDAIGVNARFNVLNGITSDGNNLYVTDSNNTIRMITLVSTPLIPQYSVTTLAGSPGTYGYNDGVQAAAQFNQPTGITTDGLHLYVSDFGNSLIRMITLGTGNVTTIAGTYFPGGGALGSSNDSTDGTGLTATFNQPFGITTDGTSLYVVDSYDNTVRKIVLSPGTVYSGPVTTIAINGTAGDITTFGITTDGTSLYVTDFPTYLTSTNLNSIQVIQ